LDDVAKKPKKNVLSAPGREPSSEKTKKMQRVETQETAELRFIEEIPERKGKRIKLKRGNTDAFEPRCSKNIKSPQREDRVRLLSWQRALTEGEEQATE